MKLSVFLAALTIVGTASAAIPRPEIPRWVDSSKHGFGYLLSKPKGKSAAYEGYIELAYDFDYDCMRTAFFNYTDLSFQESTYCKGKLSEYDSLNKRCVKSRPRAPSTVEATVTGWVNSFIRNMGTSFADPIWQRGSYSIIKNPTANLLLYIKESVNAVEYIVDQSNPNKTFYYYFPALIRSDKEVTGVWDFNMKYGSCSKEDALSFFSNKSPMNSLIHRNVP
jgi:hypothetical protein